MRRVARRLANLPKKLPPPSARQPSAPRPRQRADAFSAHLELTGFRGVATTPEAARAQFDTPLMKQFIADLRAEAARRKVAVEHLEPQLGRWKTGLEPSLKVLVRDGREGVLKLAATLGAAYNQDAVLVLSKGKTATVYSIGLPRSVGLKEAAALLDAHGLPGSSASLDGRTVTVLAFGDDHAKVKRVLAAMDGETVEKHRRGADFIERHEYAQVLGLTERPHEPAPYDLHFPVGALTA